MIVWVFRGEVQEVAVQPSTPAVQVRPRGNQAPTKAAAIDKQQLR